MCCFHIHSPLVKVRWCFGLCRRWASCGWEKWRSCWLRRSGLRYGRRSRCWRYPATPGMAGDRANEHWTHDGIFPEILWKILFSCKRGCVARSFLFRSMKICIYSRCPFNEYVLLDYCVCHTWFNHVSSESLNIAYSTDQPNLNIKFEAFLQK